MRRRRDKEETENQERWLVSYADFITLLFAFFVVMYALSSVNEGKYRILSDSLDAAFHGEPRSMDPVQSGSLSRSALETVINTRGLGQIGDLEPLLSSPAVPPPPVPPMPEDTRPLDVMEAEITEAMRDLIDRGVVDVRNNGRWLEVEINTSILFPSGSARLSGEAVSVLASLANVLGDFPNRIQVEGFTDDVPISNRIYPSNWELSAARAARVVRLLSQNRIASERLVAIGHGQNHPRANNDTEQGRSKNRRVLLTIPGEKGLASNKVMSGLADGNIVSVVE